MVECNCVKVELLYWVIDDFSGFYVNLIELFVCLCMNVLFILKDVVLDVSFFEELEVVGLFVLKGYKVVGGMCVLFYNVVLLEVV